MESGAVDLAAGYYFSLITQADKKIISFGKNETGQLGTGEPLWHTSPQKLPNFKIRDAATNGNGSYFVDLNGSLWSVGTENWGDLGNGSSSHVSSPVKIVSENVSAVQSVHETVLFLDHNGSLHGFGNGAHGKLETIRRAIVTADHDLRFERHGFCKWTRSFRHGFVRWFTMDFRPRQLWTIGRWEHYEPFVTRQDRGCSLPKSPQGHIILFFSRTTDRFGRWEEINSVNWEMVRKAIVRPRTSSLKRMPRALLVVSGTPSF